MAKAKPSGHALRSLPRPNVPRSRSTAQTKAVIATDEWNEALADTGADAASASDEELEQEREQAPAPRASRFAPAPGPAQRPMSAMPRPAAPPANALNLRTPTFLDYDRLWDWCRQNVQGAERFFGIMPQYSQALFDYLNALLQLEASDQARVRSLYVGDAHIGLATLVPIDRTSAHPNGYAHCFLAPEYYGKLAQLMPAMLDAVSELEPTLTIRVAAHDIAFAKLLEPHGFTTEITLSRPPNQNRG